MKTETTKVEEIMTALAANAGGKSGARIKNRNYDIQVGDMTKKYAPQCLGVIGVLLGLVSDENGEVNGGIVSEAQICSTLEDNEDKFTSVQGSWKLFQYYRKTLVEAGFLTEVASDEVDK